MESLKLQMPACPECGSPKTKIDIRDYSNLVRIPAAVATGTVIGIPLPAISFVCPECGFAFKDRGGE
jgi:predicted RNA-binding Zn-ribbon protein involved in translation (DUF1610 family)